MTAALPLNVPPRLNAPAPGWTVRADVAVVGSGIAGLTTALQIARHSGLRVLLVTKDLLAAGSTRWAQGGIAAALGLGDSPDEHFADTMSAGAGICDPTAVRLLVREGPAAVRELAQIGARFDRDRQGSLALTREGGHHRDRIAHAGGDATGAEIERALVTRVLDASGIEILEHAMMLDLLFSAGTVAGLSVHVLGEGQRDGVGAILAPIVVLAAGGIGQVFASTTNPAVSTGDGLAAALRAGAVVRDIEFVQFHPTVAYLGSHARGQQPLVSEAVRGEGAFLVDDRGARFMREVHPLADLAPRDIVAKAIVTRMLATGAGHMWLDGRHFGAEKWRVRFPTIHATLLSHGIDPVHDLIPVLPASHYASGGVRTDLNGESSISGLFVCGESACSGVHGANRLASNSLLEGLVFGRRIADTVVARLAEADRRWLEPDAIGGPLDAPVHRLLADGHRPRLQRVMSRHAGVLRSAAGLHEAAGALAELAAQPPAAPATENWEATNLLTVAISLVHAAALRQETRGSHWRDDFPDRDDEQWGGQLDLTALPDGSLKSEFVRITP